MVVGLDPTDSDRLNEELLGFAETAAGPINQPLHVVHAYEPVDESFFLGGAIDAGDVATHAHAVRESHTAAVESTIKAVGLGAGTIVHVERAPPPP